MGHGIVTKDPKDAARIFLSRDHDKIEALLVHYRNGKLGVYMVPPMFFGEVPEAVILEEYNGEFVNKQQCKKATRVQV